MTTVLHTANVTNIGDYAVANVSITYKRENDKSSYGVNIDQIVLRDISSFGVRNQK